MSFLQKLQKILDKRWCFKEHTSWWWNKKVTKHSSNSKHSTTPSSSSPSTSSTSPAAKISASVPEIDPTQIHVDPVERNFGEGLLLTLLSSTTKTKNKVKSGFVLDVVIGESVVIVQGSYEVLTVAKLYQERGCH